jgi:general secretion pathway protein L
VPPLSPPRLKAALPNLVEEHLITDPADCVLVAGASADGMRTIAVVQRAWLDTIANALGPDVRSTIAVPAQLCLPARADAVSAAIEPRADEIAVTVRLSLQEGLGLALPAASSARDVTDTIAALARDANIALHVPDALLRDYRTAVEATPELARRVTLARADEACWLEGVDSAGLDLLPGLDRRQRRDDAWRRWRWPAALAAGLVAINVVGLYADWWRMKSEADGLRATMVRTFASAYPKETVILDPAAQMKQKIAASRVAAGQLAPDDFLMLVSAFGDAWTRIPRSAADGKAPQIAALEYRERSLAVRVPGGPDTAGNAVTDGLRARGLALTRPSAGTWQLRSSK